MISYEIYKIVHLTGIALLLLGLGIVLGGYATSPKIPGKLRLAGFLAHGLGLLVALVGGFGMAARLGIVNGLPSWIYGKLIIWMLLGVGISFAKRRAQNSILILFIFAGLVSTATYLAIFKP